jgi:hypothetical protein
MNSAALPGLSVVVVFDEVSRHQSDPQAHSGRPGHHVAGWHFITFILYKHFYPEGAGANLGDDQGNGKKHSGISGLGGIGREKSVFILSEFRAITPSPDIPGTRPPQGHSRGSDSKIFLINRAHVLRASLEPSELSRSGSLAAGQPAVLSSGVAMGTRPRLE